MSGGNGGVIGAAVVPTSTAASGVWRPSTIARQLNGALNGQFWPSLADANFSSNTLVCNGQKFTTDGHLNDPSPSANHLWFSTPGSAGPVAAGKFQTLAFQNNTTSAGGLYVGSVSSSSMLMGTGDFTLELWFYVTLATTFQGLIDLRTADVSVTAPTLRITSAGKLQASINSTVGTNVITGGTTISLNAWHHAHWTRISGVSYLGLDGAQEGSDYSDSNNYNSHNGCYIGRLAGSTTYSMQGRFLPVRITKGLARYSRSYTVPTAPFPDY